MLIIFDHCVKKEVTYMVYSSLITMYNHILLYSHHVTTNMQVDIYSANLKEILWE